MFVSVYCDFANDDHEKNISELLLQYGFKKVMPRFFESTTIDSTTLVRLKKDLDRQTDAYDVIRIYQYPLENTLVITSLKDKKWKKFKILTK